MGPNRIWKVNIIFIYQLVIDQSNSNECQYVYFPDFPARMDRPRAGSPRSREVRAPDPSFVRNQEDLASHDGPSGRAPSIRRGYERTLIFLLKMHRT